MKGPVVTSLRKLYQFYLVVHTSCVMQYIIMYVSVVCITNVLKNTHTHLFSLHCTLLPCLSSRVAQCSSRGRGTGNRARGERRQSERLPILVVVEVLSRERETEDLHMDEFNG